MREKVTKAVILAAGEGRRLRPLTQETPKAMLPVGGVPLLERLVRYLAAQGVREIAINLHHAPGMVVHYFGDGAAWGVRLTYSYEPRILGTAGAVRKLQDFLTETFFVVYGDLLTEVDLARVTAFHRERRAVGTIVLYRVADPWERSVVELDGQERVLRFVEKPPREQGSNGLANAGIYVLEPEVVAHIPPGVSYDFGFQLFPDLLAKGVALQGYVTEEFVLDIGSPDAYQRAQQEALARGMR